MCVCAKLLRSCPTLCDPMDCSPAGFSVHGILPPGFSVHGILQARILEWVAIPSSTGSSPPRDQTCISYVSCIGRPVLYHKHHLGSPLLTIVDIFCAHTSLLPNAGGSNLVSFDSPPIFHLAHMVLGILASQSNLTPCWQQLGPRWNTMQVKESPRLTGTC